MATLRHRHLPLPRSQVTTNIVAATFVEVHALNSADVLPVLRAQEAREKELDETQQPSEANDESPLLSRVTSVESLPPTPLPKAASARGQSSSADAVSPRPYAPSTQALVFGRDLARALAEQRQTGPSSRRNSLPTKNVVEKTAERTGTGSDKPSRRFSSIPLGAASRLRDAGSSGAISVSRSTDPELSRRGELLHSLTGPQGRARLKSTGRAEEVVRRSPNLARRASAVVEQLASKVGLDSMIDGMSVAIEGAAASPRRRRESVHCATC